MISEKDSPFARLDHHKLHEMGSQPSRTPKVNNIITIKAPNNIKRKRGRPPKYHKNEIPIIPRFTLTEDEILSQPVVLPNGEENPLSRGLKKFAYKEACPDEKCMFFGREHFHCVRKKCYHASDRSDILNLHVKEFHSHITIMDGFEFFDQSVNCRRPHCNNNRANRHFHCTRQRCDYSFVRYSTMAQHDHKHRMAELNRQFGSPAVGVPTANLQSYYQKITAAAMLSKPDNNSVDNFTVDGVAVAQAAIEAISANNSSLIHTEGKSITKNLNQQTIVTDNPPDEIKVNDGFIGADLSTRNTHDTLRSRVITPINIVPLSPVNTSAPASPSTDMYSPTATVNDSLRQQLQEAHRREIESRPVIKYNWFTMKVDMHIAAIVNCGQFNCKYIKLDHYHCKICTTPFRESNTLKHHIQNIHQVKFCKDLLEANNKTEHIELIKPDIEEPSLSSSLTLNPTTFAKLLKSSQSTVEQCDPIPIPMHVDVECCGAIDLRMSNRKQGEEKIEQSEQIERTTSTPRKSEHKLDVQPSPPINLMDLLQKQLNPGLQIRPESPVDLDAHIVNTKATDSSNKDQPSVLSESHILEKSQTCRVESANPPGDDFTRALMLTPVIAFTELISSEKTKTHEASKENKSKATRAKKQTISRKRGVARLSNEDTPNKRVSTGSTSDASIIGRGVTDVKLPDAYIRFRYNTECTFNSCTYSNSMTHYHCTRQNCGYAFSDRSRIYPHENKHAKMEMLMGDDFDKSRINRECPHEGCEFSHKYTHYHCKKCTFKCTDSGRVYSHRKTHATDN